MNRNWLIALAVAATAIGGYYAFTTLGRSELPAGIAGGNGRIEAIEIDIATRIPGRIREIVVNEGDFVTAGQVLARMDTDQLEAQRTAALAVIAQREAQLDSRRCSPSGS